MPEESRGQGRKTSLGLGRVAYWLSMMHEVDKHVSTMGIFIPSCLGYLVEAYEPTPRKGLMQQKSSVIDRLSACLIYTTKSRCPLFNVSPGLGLIQHLHTPLRQTAHQYVQTTH